MSATAAVSHPVRRSSRLGLAAQGPRGAEMTISLSGAAVVLVRIKSLAGNEIAALPATPCTAGRGTLRWDGCGSHGRPLPAGCYFAEILGVNAAGESTTCLVPLQQ